MNRLRVIFLVLALNISCTKHQLIEVEKFDVKSKNIEAGIYKSMDGIYSELNRIKREHSSDVQLFSIGNSSVKKKIIPLLRIKLGNKGWSNNYLFVSGTHGDEGAPVEAMLFTINNILNEKDKLSLPNGKSIILDFIPVHNPDGYIENQRNNSNGIDLNRNFPIGTSEKIEKENAAVIDLINTSPYSMSLFFHSANEIKYENMIRKPVEYSNLGNSALSDAMNNKLNKMISIIENSSQVDSNSNNWEIHSDMVSKPGIASDWCTSGEIISKYMELINIECKYFHPSLTIELCYPKTPFDENKLRNEKLEAYSIITSLINEY